MRTAFLLLFALLPGGCGGDGATTGPSNSATLVGTVRSARTQAAVAGAILKVGGATATSGADGTFELRELPVGQAVTVEVSAQRFESHTQQVPVRAGANRLDVALEVRTLYTHGELAAYIDPDVASFRGAILVVPGSGGDIRPMILGETGSICREFCGRYQEVLGVLRQLAEKYDLAVLGSNTLPLDPSPHAQVFASMAAIGEQSGHDELGAAPILPFGHSLGGCYAYNLAREHAARVIGFISGKGGCHTPADAGAGARGVPGYLFIGERDIPSRGSNIRTVFEENRARGAPWAVATEPNAEHEPIRDIALQIRWMDAVLALRLPPAGSGGGLRSTDVAAGWVGDHATYVIAPVTGYPGDPAKGSWLPTEESARDWKRLVERTTDQ